MGTVTRLPAGTTLNDFCVEFIGPLPPFSAERQKEIQANWLEATASNPSLENNHVHFVAEESLNCHHFRVYSSTYDVFKWQRNRQQGSRSLYLVNVVTVLEGEDFLFFGVSGEKTLHAGKIVPIGGMLDQDNMAESNPFYSNFSKELKEEAGLEADNPEQISSYSVAYLGRRNSRSVELIVKAYTPLSRNQLITQVMEKSDGEFPKSFFLSKEKSAVEEFLHSDSPRWENLNPLLRDMFDL